MQVGGGRKAYDEINITPMLDLAYVLLVIFILMATASVQGIKVDLPKASSAKSLVQPKTIALTVSNDGQIYMDAFPVTIPDLETRLRNAKATDPEVPIVLKGDQTAQYGKIMEVLDLCRRLDLNKVGLVTGKQAAS
ncbi:biopolymer transporter ExbD [Sphingorhabdus sp. IMCC26285]|jgi:biopolymer transport protein ExbD|uniref:Biopolymer transporter ExbD n=1 Tax=Sphingorhabdus profundilacus TaxID=2509718 RepID=A0A6I4LT15_9SPHN|nr:biopolymer transporter ExbD [Sphingorhabdus profundilacus]MVZ96577.1 biopolymer transporter ExbD [Sphingorhabdus profundilacus]